MVGKCIVCDDKQAEILNYCQEHYDETVQDFREYIETGEFPDYSCNEVSEGLFVGDYKSGANLEFLESEGITHILIISHFAFPVFPGKFEYLHFKLDDKEEEQLLPFFEKAIAFLSKAKKALVHCEMGISRSTTFAAAFLMKTKDLSADETLALMQAKRKICQPNSGFIEQLKKFENINF